MNIADRCQPSLAVLGAVESPRKFVFGCEGSLFEPLETTFKGVIGLLCVYYTLNYVYSPHVNKSQQFQQRLWLQVKNRNVTDAVKELGLY